MTQRSEINELLKKHFIFNKRSNSLSASIKEELIRLGAFKPFYCKDENDRSIKLIDMWGSQIEEVKNIVRDEVRKEFGKVDESIINSIYETTLKRRAMMIEKRKKTKIKKVNEM